VAFHLNAACFLPKHMKHIKISHGHRLTTLRCQNDQLRALATTWKGSIAFYIMLPSRLMFTKSITVSVAVSNMGVVLIKHRSTMDIMAGIVLLSQQMLDAIIASFTTVLSYSKTVHRCILHSAQSNCCSAKLSTSFLLSSTPLTVRSIQSYSSTSISYKYQD